MRLGSITSGLATVIPGPWANRNSDKTLFGGLGVKDAVDKVVDQILKPFAFSGHCSISSTLLQFCYAARMPTGSLFCREGTVRWRFFEVVV